MSFFLKTYAESAYSGSALDCSIHTLPHLGYARSLVRAVAESSIQSSYSHSNHIIENDNNHIPHYQFNCYGFLNFVLETACPSSLKELQDLQKQYLSDLPVSYDHKILPFHLATLCMRLEQPTVYWDVVRDMKNLQSGDILTYHNHGYVLPDHPLPLTQKTGTHVMLVDEIHEICNAKNHTITHLTIIDATRRPHNRKDSRYHQDKEKHTHGIGISPLRLIQDKSLKECVIQWSPKGKVHEKIISILRLNNTFLNNP